MRMYPMLAGALAAEHQRDLRAHAERVRLGRMEATAKQDTVRRRRVLRHTRFRPAFTFHAHRAAIGAGQHRA